MAQRDNDKRIIGQGPRVFLGMGSNMGERGVWMARAMALLHGREDVCVVDVSPVFETAPMYKTDQPTFWNAVIEIRTTLDAQALLAVLLEIEHTLGRVRLMHNGPRTLDLDIVYFGQDLIDLPGLQVPHVLRLERGFVLGPMRALAPSWVDPISGQTMAQAWAALPEGQRVIHMVSWSWPDLDAL